ncbi:hypothetical protein G9A89_023787 [Geosiphon pyriformis]|nr:hypothetical protein G9A89_023787 [Geosiphon pyriformis]
MILPPVVNGLFVDNIIEFQIEAPVEIGWVGLGIGKNMIESYMMATWPNQDGTITVSQRQANDHSMPIATNRQSELSSSSDIKNGIMTIKIKRAISVSGSTININTNQTFVWAFSRTNPMDSSVNAKLSPHLPYNDQRNSFSVNLLLNIPKPKAGSGAGWMEPKKNKNSKLSDSENQNLVIAHGLFMSAAWLIAFPIAIYFIRFGRDLWPTTYYNLHWAIQTCGTLGLSLIGYILVQVQNGEWPSPTTKAHAKMGTFIFYGISGVILLGGIHHRFHDPKREYTPWWIKLHSWVGRGFVLLAFVQIHLGLLAFNASLTCRAEKMDAAASRKQQILMVEHRFRKM